MYLPVESSHPKHQFTGIVLTELFRIRRCSQTTEQFWQQVYFFVDKLLTRGYPHKLIRSTIDKFGKTSAFSFPSRPEPPSVVIPLVIPHSAYMKDLSFVNICGMFVNILPHNMRSRLRFITCYTAAPNLFLQRYSRFF